MLRVDGDEVVNLASMTPEWVGLRYALAGTVTERVVTEARTVHLHGPRDEQGERYPGNPVVEDQRGISVLQLGTPLMRRGQPIGALALARHEHLPFDERQIALLETFADQAVIAIENTRLFSELERRNGELQESNRQVTEALEQQTATAEILRIIASSPTDLQPVLDAMAVNAARLCDASDAFISLLDGDRLVPRGFWASYSPFGGTFGGAGLRVSRGSVMGRQ